MREIALGAFCLLLLLAIPKEIVRHGRALIRARQGRPIPEPLEDQVWLDQAFVGTLGGVLFLTLDYGVMGTVTRDSGSATTSTPLQGSACSCT